MLNNTFTVLCMGVSAACMSVHHIHAYPLKSEEGVGSLGPGVRDGHELPSGCRELNQSPLEG